MTPERPHWQKPYEVFDITEAEVACWRVTDEKLREILANPNTTTHTIKMDTNTFGEFFFLTASRGKGQQRVCMTFYGLGFHEYRERWITEEWFWHQAPTDSVSLTEKLSFEKVQSKLTERLDEITPKVSKNKQTDLGRMFDCLADTTDDDAALAEMQDLGLIS